MLSVEFIHILFSRSREKAKMFKTKKSWISQRWDDLVGKKPPPLPATLCIFGFVRKRLIFMAKEKNSEIPRDIRSPGPCLPPGTFADYSIGQFDTWRHKQLFQTALFFLRPNAKWLSNYLQTEGVTCMHVCIGYVKFSRKEKLKTLSRHRASLACQTKIIVPTREQAFDKSLFLEFSRNLCV